MTPSTEFCIVPLESRHIDAVAAIEQATFSDPWSSAMIRDELQNTMARWFVLEYAGEVAGYVAALNICGEVHITNVAVLPQYRRRGLARLLMERAVEYARAANAFCMTLEVRQSNRAAIALYEGLGFRATELRENYYEDGEAAYGMELTRRAPKGG